MTMVDIHGTITDSSAFVSSKVHVLRAIGLVADVQSAVALPGKALPIHAITAIICRD